MADFQCKGTIFIPNFQTFAKRRKAFIYFNNISQL